MKKLRQISILLLTTVIMSTNLAYAEQIVKDQIYFDAVKEYVMDNYALEVTEQQLYDAAIKGMFDALDPYSTYLDKEEYKSFLEEATGNFAGIGAVVGKKDEGFYIVSINPDSPASKSGLKPMDLLISVNDQKIDIKQETESLIKIIRGEAGTSVKLTIKRESETISMDIVRAIIQINPIEYKTLEKNLGYIKINEFNNNTYINITKAIQDLKKQDSKKLILDLRGNPGGSLDQVLKVANYFVPKGKTLEVQYKEGKPDIYYSTGDIQFDKVVVLIDGNTASASEILAGAIQDTKAGTLIGTTSYGKGVVQDLYSLKNGEAIKLTIAKYVLPSGRSINLKGLNPDIKIEYDIPEKGSDTDNQLNEAIKIIKQK